MEVLCAQCGAKAAGNFCANCGNNIGAKPAAASNGADDVDDALRVLAKTLGIQELLYTLLTIFKPLTRIRAVLAMPSPMLASVVTAYIEMVTLLPLLNKHVALRLGRAVGYPVIYQGPIIETQILFYLFAAVGGALGLAIIYMLPRRWFEPVRRSTVFMVNLQIGMYVVVYLSAADLAKIALWALTGSFATVAILGWAALIAASVFAIYILRRALALRWRTIVVLFVIANIVSFLQAFIAARAGWLQVAT